jgi:hypothetical protein
MRIARSARWIVILGMLCFASSVHAEDYVETILAYDPLAYRRLDENDATSLVGGYGSTYLNGATTTALGSGPPIAGHPDNAALATNGNNAIPHLVTTGLSGGIPGRGSMVAWVYLNRLPSASGTYFYVAGELQYSNDFDVQFQNDDRLYFYTGAGENTSYLPDPGTLVGRWNQLAVAYDGSVGFRKVYWNGALVSSFVGGVNPAPKTSNFAIGYSQVFPGRDFDGMIDEVAVFDYALSAGQVSQLYATAVPEPATSASLGAGTNVLALVGRWHRKRGGLFAYKGVRPLSSRTPVGFQDTGQFETA